MYIFYRGEKNNYIYIGNTNDLKRRFIEHNQGRIYATKSMTAKRAGFNSPRLLPRKMRGGGAH